MQLRTRAAPSSAPTPARTILPAAEAGQNVKPIQALRAIEGIRCLVSTATGAESCDAVDHSFATVLAKRSPVDLITQVAFAFRTSSELIAGVNTKGHQAPARLASSVLGAPGCTPSESNSILSPETDPGN